MRRILKVSTTAKRGKSACEQSVHIVHEQLNQQGKYDELALTSDDKPSPAFAAALAEHVVAICELPYGDRERITVTGVSFSYTDAGVMGATIIARKELLRSTAPLNLTTPFKFESFPGGGDAGDERQLLAQDCVHGLNDVCRECWRYLDGERAQLTLFSATLAPETPAMGLPPAGAVEVHLSPVTTETPQGEAFSLDTLPPVVADPFANDTEEGEEDA
jgi:hypothetical protein